MFPIFTTFRPAFVLLSVVLLTILTPGWAFSSATPEQKREIVQLRAAIRRGGAFYSKRQFQQSVEVIEDVQKRYEKLAEVEDQQLQKLLRPVFASLHKAHVLLELEGVRLPPLKKLGENGSAAVSFVKQVAPILTGKCGGCHIDNARGEFSMATFTELLTGPSAGKVIFAGDPTNSRLIEVIESGDMPRGGAKISPAEFSLLKKWIAEGAKFDGRNPQTNLRSLAPAPTPSSTPNMTLTSTGSGGVSFAKTLAPVLVKNCTNCHGAQRPRGRFRLTTFTLLMRGGENGAPIVPGRPADSLLIKKLKGTAEGQRMPAAQPPLADAVIANIEAWIGQGAKFDGPDADQNVAQVAALARASSATHEELSAERASLAQSNWRLGMPNTSANQVETKNFLIVGKAGPETLSRYGKQAEPIAGQVAKMLRAPEDRPLIKGRMTLFFFSDRYEYSEFGQMVEKRALPKPWRGHWTYTIVDAYGAMITPRGDQYALEPLIAQQFAGAYVASLSASAPTWYSEGVARVLASRVGVGDPRVKAWNQQIASALSAMAKPDDFLTGKLPPEPSAVLGYSFVKFLMKQSRLHNRLLDELRKGADFDKAFLTIYQATPQQLTNVWVRSAAKAR